MVRLGGLALDPAECRLPLLTSSFAEATFEATTPTFKIHSYGSIKSLQHIFPKMATQLVPLREVERLSSSVIRILGGNPGKVCYGSHVDKLLHFADQSCSLLCKVRLSIILLEPTKHDLISY